MNRATTISQTNINKSNIPSDFRLQNNVNHKSSQYFQRRCKYNLSKTKTALWKSKLLFYHVVETSTTSGTNASE